MNRWPGHPAAAHAAPAWRDWRLAPCPLTARLRAHCLLLVTELFLPAMAQLMPRRLIPTEPDRQ